MNDEQLQAVSEGIALAATSTVAYFKSLRQQGMTRREALRLTEAWVGQNTTVQQASPGMVIHGAN